MLKLTEKQKEIIDFIRKYRKDKGTLPSRADIGRHFNWSSPSYPTKAIGYLIAKRWLESSNNPVGYKFSAEYENDMRNKSIERIKRKIKESPNT